MKEGVRVPNVAAGIKGIGGEPEASHLEDLARYQFLSLASLTPALKTSI
jgi:hypothetical protein